MRSVPVEFFSSATSPVTNAAGFSGSGVQSTVYA